MLQGLMLPVGMLGNIEQILRSITGIVIAAEQASQERHVWILFHTFTFDQAMDDVRACKSSLTVCRANRSWKLMFGYSPPECFLYS